jgi:thymidylate kinase
MLIVIDGQDGVGKTTLIQSIDCNKYETMSFPVDRSILNRPFDIKNREDVIAHHSLFLEDFTNYQDIMEEKMRKGKPLILDRYFPSHWAYLNRDLYLSYEFSPSQYLDDSHILREMQLELFKFYWQLPQPDYMIYIRPKDASRYDGSIHANYMDLLEYYPFKEYKIFDQFETKNGRILNDIASKK